VGDCAGVKPLELVRYKDLRKGFGVKLEMENLSFDQDGDRCYNLNGGKSRESLPGLDRIYDFCRQKGEVGCKNCG
jgi:hypothetical protein